MGKKNTPLSGKHREKRPSFRRDLILRMREKTPGKITRKNYKCHIKYFVAWCNMRGITRAQVMQNPISMIQRYYDYLKQKGDLKAATRKTYLVGVCVALNVSMRDITYDTPYPEWARARELNRPSLLSAERDGPDSPEWFNAKVGLRKGEIKRLRGGDYFRGADGFLYIYVRKGKGGKRQAQFIRPDDEADVLSAFRGKAEGELLFPNFQNHLSLQYYRIVNARKKYDQILEQLSNPEWREKLRQKLIDRYCDPELGCKRYLLALEARDTKKAHRCLEGFSYAMRDGSYRLRGKHYRERAAECGRPMEYDRLALMFVSVFCLSHWRLDVTVHNYML